MQIRRTVTILTLLIALIFCSSLLAQKKPDSHSNQGKSSLPEQQRAFEGWTEEQGLNFLELALSDGDNDMGVTSICLDLSNLAKLAASLQSEKLVQKILDIPVYESFNEKYPEYDYDVTDAKIKALANLKDFPGVWEFMIQSLNHESHRVQIAASSTLLFWGEEWEQTSKIISKNEEYFEYQKYHDERAVPILEEAVVNASWKGRLYAAAALYYTYGDSSWYPKVVSDVILNAPINTDDKEINWAKYHALRQVPRLNLESSLPGLCRLAYDNGLGIGSMAVGHLVHLSEEGFQEATQALL
ncbi:MAG: hypothetical protein J7K40_00790 [candidate division Zixibacteria bacterium]|nr:hypothetical protein [candidate division Zixibacteria bacterium]